MINTTATFTFKCRLRLQHVKPFHIVVPWVFKTSTYVVGDMAFPLRSVRSVDTVNRCVFYFDDFQADSYFTMSLYLMILK